MDRFIAILGTRSPLIVELEETCRRANVGISAVVRFAGTCRAIDQTRVISVEDLDSSTLTDGFIPCAFAPERRRALTNEGTQRGLKLAPVLVDPTAIVAHSAHVARGVYINAGAVIGGLSMIRRGALINRSASIGHHCVIGEYCSIGPGATLASNVTLEDDVIVGAGAVIIPDIHIGQGAVISAGAIVSRDVPDGALVVAERSRILKGGARRIKLREGQEE